jgi:hypothetical protein
MRAKIDSSLCALRKNAAEFSLHLKERNQLKIALNGEAKPLIEERRKPLISRNWYSTLA